ncbi:MAG: glycoside hydrolase family 44 protein [Tepidisphaeraceae bacterium]
MRRVIFLSILLGFIGQAALAQNIVHFTIDAQRDVHPISRLIYGVNQPIGQQWTHATFERFGGNRTTEYNWITNASNAGTDWHCISDDYYPGKTPGAAIASLLKNASDHNAGALITVPIIGYVAADENGDDVRTSGPNYLQTRFHQSAPVKGAPFTPTPDPNAPVVYQDEFVNWVKVNYPYGQTDANRPIWFTLDNEPDIWAENHREVHPKKTTYAELIERTIAYATAIKNVEPNALVFGPANYGWNGYVSLQDALDRQGRDFHIFYLQEMAKASAAAGKRLIDAVDIHYYPEATGGGVRVITPDSAPAVVAARLQAPRSLWDPDYMETSWITKKIHRPIEVIPELQDKITVNFPGTKIAISEYNFGGGGDISGGIAEADVLGIFGRTGVFSANEWTNAAPEPFIFIDVGFAMFRDFDGKDGSFGDTSISAITDNVPDTSIYASLDSANPNRMVLVAINKTGHAITADVRLKGSKPLSSAVVYQLTSNNPSPVSAGSMPVNDPTHFTYTMPAYSVSTINLVAP